jgi:hypothetical protein
MIYSVRLYTVDPANVPVFLAAFRRGGLWTDMARLQPGHIHTDLLRNPSDSTKFLSIEFWTSIRAVFAARDAFEVRSFLAWLDRQAIRHQGLGMFIFPAQLSTDSGGVTIAPADLAGVDVVSELQNAEMEARL